MGFYFEGKRCCFRFINGKELSGYDIKIVFEDVFTHFFDGSFGMIYPTLRQLEKEGKIKEVVMQEGKPNKKMYFITDEGRKEFYQYMQTERKTFYVQIFNEDVFR